MPFSATNSPRSITRLVLTGFMGSGKSTVGKLLAERLGWDFADLDAAVEQRTGSSVAELFASTGEPAFRAAEAAALRELLQRERMVIALGGGAVETPASRQNLQGAPATAIVFLSAPLDVLTARCAQQTQAAARPLLAQAATRFVARQPLYAALAHHTEFTERQRPAETADAILKALFSTLDV